MAARNYSRTNGTVDTAAVYGVNTQRDKQLKDPGLLNPNTGLPYTYVSAKDQFPAWVNRCERLGWSQSEVLSLYECESAINDGIMSNDSYMGIGGYLHPIVTQSRAKILIPDGWYRFAYGIQHGLNRIIGKSPNVYSDRSGSNPGCTPGTALQVDSANWLTARAPVRIIAPASAWGQSFAVIGGLAYTEGIGFESIRFVGGTDDLPLDPSYKSHGIAMSHPGENSFLRDCMFTGFNGSAVLCLGSTPGMMDQCSLFNNDEYGIELQGNNGLSNLIIIQPSGDNNRKALIGSKPFDGSSVGGGTFAVIGSKSEARAIKQQLFKSEGPCGQLNLQLIGVTCDYSGIAVENMIEIEQGTQFQVEVQGLQHSSGLTNLFKHTALGWTIPATTPFRGISFGVNDEGLFMKSRSSTVLVNGTVPPPPPPPPPPVDPPTTGTTLESAVIAGSDQYGQHPYNLAVDGSASSYALSGRSMQVGDVYLFKFASKMVTRFTGVAPAYYTNSWARKFDIELLIGSQWVKQNTTPFVGAFTSNVTFTGGVATQLRFTVREANQNWLGWSNVTIQ